MKDYDPELLQIHWEYKDGRLSEFVSQREIKDYQEMKKWLDELWRDNPPPDGAVFVVRTERHPQFIVTD